MELIRPIVRVGNSAGVILPREWLNGKAKIQLVARPLDVKKEVFEILEDYLQDIIGIYLVGSYAREEQTDESDVDVLVITNNTNKVIERGKYYITLVSKDKVESSIVNGILPLLPMIKEAKPLLNGELIEKYKDTSLTRKNLDWHIEGTKSILKVVRAEIDLDNELNSKCRDSVAYPLVLRLREIYIVDCLKKGKLWSNKELLRIIKKIAGSLKAYEGYLRVKNNRPLKEYLSIEEAEKLYNYVYSKIREQEKWVKIGK
jgi:predicted nucleotidyltransferase